MRKSGLHKQISSIFDGVPVPQNNGHPETADVSSSQMQPDGQDMTELQVQPEPASVSTTAAPSLIKRMSADPSECASAPVLQVNRPMPLPKSSAMAAKTGPGMSSQIRKIIFGSSKGSLDAHQKKMAVLVAVLCVVFGGVMFISLGGVGQAKATAAESTTEEPAGQNPGTKKTAQDWKSPQPLPADLRDATSTVSKQTASSPDSAEVSVSGDLVVKGIVFSRNKPSAIINNQILTEGETFNGVTIVKITKEAVEFKANDKQWTQQVQR
jgi:hypothetical protein